MIARTETHAGIISMGVIPLTFLLPLLWFPPGGLFLFPGTATALTLSRAVGILNPLPFSNLATERRCRLWKSSQASLWPSQQVYLAIASASGLMVTARASKHKEPPGVAAPGGSLFCVSALVTSQASLACGYYTTPI